MEDVMLDLETLSTRPNAVILIIAAIKFDRTSEIKELKDYPQFYKKIEIQSCLDIGLKKDLSTIEWWDKQDKEIRNEALYGSLRIHIRDALAEFSKWFEGSKYIWGNGDDFDCTILGEAYYKSGIRVPWKFWNTRDCRTLFDIGNVSKQDLPIDNQHHALYDCYRQIVGVKLAYQNLRL